MDQFIDFTASFNGDGSAAGQAGSPGGVGARNRFILTDYPAGTTYDIWIRRAGSYGLSSQLILNQANIHMIGWPKVGDPDYLTRPSVPTWDSDTNNYAKITSVAGVDNILIQTGLGQIFRRMEFTQTSSGVYWVRVSITCEFTNCRLLSQNANKTLDINPDDATNKAVFTNCLIEATSSGTALNTLENDCHFLNCSFLNSTASSAVLASINNGADTLFDTCTFDQYGSGTVLGTSAAANDYSNMTFLNCVVDAHGGNAGISIGNATSIYGMVARVSTIFIEQVNSGSYISNPADRPIHFSEYTQTVASTWGLQVFSPCTVVINNATFQANTSGDIRCKFGGRVYLNNAKLSQEFRTVAHNIPGHLSDVEYPGIFSSDHGGANKSWQRINKYGIAKRDDINLRTGGNVFSIVGTYNNFADDNLSAYTRYIPVEISPVGNETLFLKLLPGSRTVTMYFTTLASLIECWFEIEYLDSSPHRAVASSRGNVSIDTSVWVHPGTFIYKTQVTFTVGQRTLAPVRIFLWENSTTLTYIDPQLVVT